MRILAALTMATLLSACGTTQPDRTEGGAAGGAATGAAVGLIGGPIGVVVGALMGGGAGALPGAAVDHRDLNLGAPPWSDTEGSDSDRQASVAAIPQNSGVAASMPPGENPVR
jgi:phage tail tape-measure protein